MSEEHREDTEACKAWFSTLLHHTLRKSSWVLLLLTWQPQPVLFFNTSHLAPFDVYCDSKPERYFSRLFEEASNA